MFNAGAIFVLIESSAAGETVLGVFSSLGAAREAIPVSDVERLRDYRIEVHALDEAPSTVRPWLVVIEREGSVLSASPLIPCSGCDEELTYATASYIDAEGLRLHQLVWHVSPGLAIQAAQERRRHLLSDSLWQAGVLLPSIEQSIIAVGQG
jgi:hypothetical protein